MTRWLFSVGDRVRKRIGDYEFEGHVVTRFEKRRLSEDGKGVKRYVVENDQGLLMIMHGGQIEREP